MPNRRLLLRKRLLTWVLTSIALAAFVAATSTFRAGFGWSGTNALSICHGGVFYVQTPIPEFHTGFYLRREEVYLDWKYEAGNVPGLSKYVFVPLWPLVIPLLAVAGIVFARGRLAKNWQCPVCKYDLRGVVAGVCPECGTSR